MPIPPPDETPVTPAPAAEAPVAAPPEPPAEVLASPLPDPGEAAALKDRLLRLQADFDNFRKRTARERAELSQRANEDLMGELLQVLDHMDLARDAANRHESAAPFVEGLKLVIDQLYAVLTRFGLSRFDVAPGSAFDVRQHEAISHMPSETVPEDGVIAQTRRGYKLGERLLRPAQVVVSSGWTEPAPEAPAQEAGVTP